MWQLINIANQSHPQVCYICLCNNRGVAGSSYSSACFTLLNSTHLHVPAINIYSFEQGFMRHLCASATPI